MLTLVRRARRRLLFNELFSEGAAAASFALVTFIVLLLLGTQVLSWRWVVAIPLAAAALGAYRLRRRIPSLYKTAQMVDGRMGLADMLSTALYFSQSAPPKGSEALRELQLEQAERAARCLDARDAVPFRMPRAAYPLAALVLVASSLFALRYGMNRRLDLKAPIAHFLQQTFGSDPKTEQARNAEKNLPPELQQRSDDASEGVQDPERQEGDREEDAAAVSENAADSQSPGTESKKTAADSKNGEEGEQAESDGKEGGDENQNNESDRSGNGQQGNNKQDQKADAGNKQDANNQGENSSLMSKVKDAWQNLMSRMKPQQNQQGSQQSSMEQKGNQSKGQQNSGKQQASKDGQQQSGGQQSDSQEGQAGDEAQNAQDPQGKGAGKSDSQQTSKQPGSGIGSQDGDKNIKQAEQLAAMGKISEILGKRSATITGESTVEVQNTSQQLHTPYQQRGVQHSQAGAEINRDEVPVALQAYVENYFEQVRKKPAPKK